MGSIQLTMGFHVPRPGCGLLFGGDLSKENLGLVAKTLTGFGYNFYTADDVTRDYLQKYVSEKVEVIDFPTTDKRALREIFQAKDIKGVFNLAAARAESLLDKDYVMRRNAI